MSESKSRSSFSTSTILGVSSSEYILYNSSIGSSQFMTSTQRRRATEDSTDSSVDKEWIRGLGLEGGTSERTTTRVGLRVQSEEDNWEYRMTDFTKATAGAKKIFQK